MADSDKRGTYRGIYTALVDDPDFRRLPSDARHTLLTLKASRINNLAGIMIFEEDHELTLKLQTGLPMARLKKALRVLEVRRWIIRDERILWFRNSLKFEPNYNRNNPKHVTAVMNILKSLPHSALINRFGEYYSIPYRLPNDKLSNGNRSTEPEPEPELETEPEKELAAGAASNPPQIDPIPYAEIVGHLNEVTGQHYRPTSDATQSLIRARWGEGFRLEDFIWVHLVKAEQWLGDQEMEGYLRPVTLYRKSKFEGYRNERPLKDRQKVSPKLRAMWENAQAFMGDDNGQ